MGHALLGLSQSQLPPSPFFKVLLQCMLTLEADAAVVTLKCACKGQRSILGAILRSYHLGFLNSLFFSLEPPLRLGCLAKEPQGPVSASIAVGLQ